MGSQKKIRISISPSAIMAPNCWSPPRGPDRNKVIGFAGDGDAYGEGLAHLIMSAKRNIDVTMIIHDNRVYGLTTGQFTPTSPLGFPGRSTPRGSIEEPINPLELMLAAGATFVARGYSVRADHLADLIKQVGDS